MKGVRPGAGPNGGGLPLAEENPRCSTAVKVAALFLAGSAFAILFTLIISHYPTAPTAIYATFGALGGLSLIFLAIRAVRYCRGDQQIQVNLNNG